MRLLIALLSLALFGAVAIGVAGVVALQYFGHDLPDYSALAHYDPPTLTRLHAGDGHPLAEYAAERRIFVPYESIPPLVREAFIAAEDKDFYKHQGVDFESIARAGFQNLEGLGSSKRPIGASTITQQVARNFFLTNEVSYRRKIREILLAFRLERALSKERILELYLNQIFLGERSYGVAAAAQGYFGKALAELTPAECAYLASLPKAPNNYHPARNHDAAVGRRNWVLGRMLEEGYITPAQHDAGLKETLAIAPRDEGQVQADYFAEEVRKELAEKFGDDAVLQGGLYVRTSVDPKLQALADQALRDGLEAYDRRHGYRGPVAKGVSGLAALKTIAKPAGAEQWQLALVTGTGSTLEVTTANGTGAIPEWAWAKNRPPARGDAVLVEAVPGKAKVYALRQVPAVQGALVAMDPNTGRVLALSGGFSHAISVFDRATQAQRQPGSSFKPFVYMAALDNGYTPSSLVVDGPVSLSQGPGLPLWQPKNYEDDFLGPATLRVGLEKSRNLMTVRIAHAIGIDKVTDIAKRFGINDNAPRYLSMAIGALETTPLKMANAYAMIVNGGKQITPSFVDMVQDRRGRAVWRRSGRVCTACQNLTWRDGLQPPEIPDPRAQIEDPRTTGQMVSMLEGVTRRGTAAALSKALDFPVAGKTGTTNESRDVWFIGFTPDLVAAIYVGFDEPKSLGGHETGATTAVPIFGQFMKAAMADRPKVPFRVPEGLVFVKVDPHTGREVEPGTPTGPDAIWEGFKPGTEPSVIGQNVLDGSGAVDGTTPTVEGDLPADEMGDDSEARGDGSVFSQTPAGAPVVDNSLSSGNDGGDPTVYREPSNAPSSAPAAPLPGPAAPVPSPIMEGTGGLY